MAFGDYGVIGARAKIDLPSLKVTPNQAFLFVPFELIITPQRARLSELNPIFEENPKFFKSHERYADFLLWVYTLYEKLKGEKSFFYPYFQAVGNSEMLMDWSSAEKAELQDRFLLFEAKKQEKIAEMYFYSLLPILESHPDFFSGGDLLKDFLWVYRLVTTRAFSHGEGMVIPFADNLNHEDVYVDYLTLSSGFLHKKLTETVVAKDYKDFMNEPHASPAPMRARTHFNKLEKLISGGDFAFNSLNNIWEVEEMLEEFESSSDVEELVNDLNEDDLTDMSEDKEESEEESEEEENAEAENENDMENKYFIMRTGGEGGFLRGKQVFNCYGRLNNTDMLIEYGFCLLPNRYDSVYVRVIVMQMIKAKNNTGKIEVSHIDLQESTRLRDFLVVYYLKYYKLNEDFLDYTRNIILSTKERYTPAGELKVVNQADKILRELQNCYPTTIEQDHELLLRAPQIPIRLYFALRNSQSGYRISQKLIIESHLHMLKTLQDIFVRVLSGESLSESHWRNKSIENAREMYPLRKYLRNLRVVTYE